MRIAPALEASASPTSLDDRYFPLKELKTYAGLSVRTLRGYLRHASYPLPCYRIGGKVLVRKSDYDAWAARFRKAPSSRVDAIVSDVIRGL